MKQFLYLDTDIVTSIIAQTEKGLITQMTNEQEKETGTEKQKAGKMEVNAGGSGKILKILQADSAISLDGQASKTEYSNNSSKEVVEKIFHDASFDIAYNYISPTKAEIEAQSYNEEGKYIEIKRVFDFADFDYIEGLFEKDGFIDFIKKQNAQQLENTVETISEGNNRNQMRAVSAKIKQEIKNQTKMNNKQLDDVLLIIKAFRCLIPYSRMMISRDGLLIPLDDKYFRINPSNLGFKYGGEMTCVGLVTNIIKKDTDVKDEDNIFATIQQSANETLRGFLSSIQNDLCVIHPIAVYYGE